MAEKKKANLWSNPQGQQIGGRSTTPNEIKQVESPLDRSLETRNSLCLAKSKEPVWEEKRRGEEIFFVLRGE